MSPVRARDHRLVPRLAQRRAEVGGAAVLPDDGVVDRAAGVAVPDHDGLALVGDADAGDVARCRRRPSRWRRGRWRRQRSRGPAGRARPSPRPGSAGRTPPAPRRRSAGPRRTGSPGWTSCPGRSQVHAPSAPPLADTPPSDGSARPPASAKPAGRADLRAAARTAWHGRAGSDHQGSARVAHGGQVAWRLARQKPAVKAVIDNIALLRGSPVPLWSFSACACAFIHVRGQRKILHLHCSARSSAASATAGSTTCRWPSRDRRPAARTRRRRPTPTLHARCNPGLDPALPQALQDVDGGDWAVQEQVLAPR